MSFKATRKSTAPKKTGGATKQGDRARANAAKTQALVGKGGGKG